jgi:hypothetical protein
VLYVWTFGGKDYISVSKLNSTLAIKYGLVMEVDKKELL